MRIRATGVLTCLALVLVALAPQQARAAGVPVTVDLTSLRCIQTYALSPKDDDSGYLLVTGVAKGEEISKRFPESGTAAAGPKKTPFPPGEAVTLWQGELDNGEFAQLTIALVIMPDGGAPGDAAAVKQVTDKLAEVGKQVAARSKKTLTADDVKALSEQTLKGQQEVVRGVKDVLSREKNTEHLAGLFTLLVWNDNGTVKKRLDPVGLTFGEHEGTDVKKYTKLKHTRNNVMIQDKADGPYFPQRMTPVSDDKNSIRVKMLETEVIKKTEKNDKGEERQRVIRNVTDYLVELQVKAGDKPLPWQLGGHHPSEKGEIQQYWDYAE